jgi:chromosome segregation protein
MQLTKLEIKGFKSFGDKVQINFGEGITAVVGPNGCGKSNIVDAIRWVLGEQKISTLRSEKLESIIFNGTKNRKATQMAEVSLSFNNTKNLLPIEYNEVTITRRFYRSGDSEYLLNGVNCRLKDITNLFLDTGIASNSYAIIELAMVDDILNDKDQSRRHLFEEAAGISKFKIRKKETLRKLQDTDADLERVADLLYEIEKNMRSLERQARQARRYLAIKEDYKIHSIEYARQSVLEQQEALERVAGQIDQQNDRKLEVVRQTAEKEADLARSKADLLEKEKLLAERQKGLNDHVTGIRNYENEKKIKHERLNFLSEKSKALKEQLTQDRESRQRSAFTLESLKNEQEEVAGLVRETENTTQSLQQELEAQRLKTDELSDTHGTLDKQQRDRKDTLYNLIKDREIKEVQVKSLETELEKTASDTTEKSASLAEFETKLSELTAGISAKEKALTDLQKSEDQLQSTIDQTQRTIDVIREEKQQTGRKLDARQNEYSLTKSLVDNLEGFPEAIKYLMKRSAWNKNVPLLSDIISCDEKYRVIIENYLEPVMNYFIVDDEGTAYHAINLLNDAAKGKAHFFILNKFDAYHAKDPQIFDNAFPATEIIEYEHKYRHLVAHLFDDVYIVRGSEEKVPRISDSTFITANGKITKRKFSLSGGSVGLFEGKKIGRTKNLENLKADLKKLQSKLDEIEENLKIRLQELDRQRGNTRKIPIDNLQEELNLLRQEKASYASKQEQMDRLLSGNTLRKEDISERINQLRNELAEIVPKVEQLNGELDSEADQLLKVNNELRMQRQMLEQKAAVYNEKNILFHKQQNKLSTLTQEISHKESTIAATDQRIDKNTKELENNESAISSLLKSNEIQEQTLVELYKEKEKIEQGVSEAERQYYHMRGLIDEIDRLLRSLHTEKDRIDELIMTLQNKANELKLEIGAVNERLSVEFNVDIGALAQPDKDDSLAQLSRDELGDKIEKFKQTLARLEPINPMAMEAYDEIKERHNFITSQKDDLEKAKDSLLNTISEIDEVAKETFLQSFEAIKHNFIEVFRSLFTEQDDCDLRLKDPEKPLESAIEIVAKPKGKKPLSISQLSGGEKTLTATALLFSIYLLKPAPFCVFDEVDAPLDDANIDKFNKIVRKFSTDSQFIIVTHNKRTMTSTDVIYGITMVEQGVSRVVPVDLRELD